MTDRVRSLTVVLDKDYREDDIQALAQAIGQMRGVVGVALDVTNPNDYSNRVRIRAELTMKLYDALKEP